MTDKSVVLITSSVCSCGILTLYANTNPNDSKELSFALHKAVRMSGLSLNDIAERLKQDYDVKATRSSLSHAIHRGTI